MTSETKAYLVGGGIGSLAAVAFMICDGNMPGANISILEAAPIMGGSLGSAGDPERGYSVRAAQMAVYELLGISRKIPPFTPHDKSLGTQFEALVKAFK